MGIRDIELTTIDGAPASMADYADKVVLVVNVASKCGLTPQYEKLEELQKEYEGRGFTVLGFPCNQFLGQEPGSGRTTYSVLTEGAAGAAGSSAIPHLGHGPGCTETDLRVHWTNKNPVLGLIFGNLWTTCACSWAGAACSFARPLRNFSGSSLNFVKQRWLQK